LLSFILRMIKSGRYSLANGTGEPTWIILHGLLIPMAIFSLLVGVCIYIFSVSPFLCNFSSCLYAIMIALCGGFKLLQGEHLVWEGERNGPKSIFGGLDLRGYDAIEDAKQHILI